MTPASSPPPASYQQEGVLFMAVGQRAGNKTKTGDRGKKRGREQGKWDICLGGQ